MVLFGENYEKLRESEKQQIRNACVESSCIVSSFLARRSIVSRGSINDDCAIAIHCILIRDAVLL